MRLSQLAAVMTPREVRGNDPEITALHYDSRTVQPGGLFFALRGVTVDGHRFIDAALAKGAAALVVDDPTGVPAGVPCIVVTDCRLAMAYAAATFYEEPTNRLLLVGVTGTNGKTTTTFLMESILAQAGFPTAVLGTISYRFGKQNIPAPNTTPESVDLQRTLREFVDAGARAAVMEVSSHALEQHRVDGCRFDAAIFTNLTRDHLDYHGDMESYFASKQRLFTDLMLADNVKPRRGVAINMDDPHGPQLAKGCVVPVISYGLGEAQVTARDLQLSASGISATLVTPQGEALLHSRLVGRFNLYNILGAVAAAIALELPLSAIISGIAGHTAVPGRLERVESDSGISVFVDYAHTGDALENVLTTISEFAHQRVITLFGCGGDRDRGKRPVMAAIAGRLSDLTIITSDNPRTEEPEAIVAEVRSGILPLALREYSADQLMEGFTDKGFVTITDRQQAIQAAIRVAHPGDIVLLAGKGHEDYQIIGTVKHHFDDREEAAAALALRQRSGN